jgi:sugar/nucleoside kinase (ribokinase family)
MVYVEGMIYEAPFSAKSFVGRTGRGDTCIANYLICRLWESPLESVRFSASATSIKMENEGPLATDYQTIIDRIN